MSKKKISFTQVPQQVAAMEFASHGLDNWVLAEPADMPEPPVHHSGRLLIDLTAPRNWFELAQLIWMFPLLATLAWMPNAMTTMLPPPKR